MCVSLRGLFAFHPSPGPPRQDVQEMEQLEYQLQRENEATRQQINKAIADRCVCVRRDSVDVRTIDMFEWNGLFVIGLKQLMF